ncbi:MAG: EAL domain-containing protein [Acholeplasmataceae bacterium]|nr:EAL domain-containing protein [Acholeplasmataceae bacterium]
MRNPYRKTGLLIRYAMIILLMVVLTVSSIMFSNVIIDRDYAQEAEAKIDLIATYIESRLPDYQDADHYIEETISKMLTAAANVVLSDQAAIDDQYLFDLAESFGLHSAIWTDLDGTSIYANRPELVGLTLDEGHPVYPFFLSDETVLIEEIRMSQVSTDYVKIGNFKSAQGHLLQLSIVAFSHEAMLDLLSVQSVIDDIMETKNVLFSRFVDPDGFVIAHSDPSYMYRYVSEAQVIRAIQDQMPMTIASHTGIEDVRTYLISRPIEGPDGAFIGVLNIGFDPEFVTPLQADAKWLSIIGGILLTLILFVNIHLGMRTRARVWEAAYIDNETKLANMKAFDIRMDRHNRQNEAIGAILIDVDHFQMITGLHGDHVGVMIMKALSTRLETLFPSLNIYRYHHSGLLVLIDGDTDINHILMSIRVLVTPEFKLDDQTFMIRVTNVVLPADVSLDKETIRMRLASTMIEAKAHHRGHDLVYDETMVDRGTYDNLIEKTLKDALKDLEHQGVTVVFQPQVELKTKKLIGFEALARLKDQNGHSISPLDFIRVAEDRGLIRDFDRIVLLECIRFNKIIRDQGLTPVPISINVSMAELTQYGFASETINVLKHHGIPGSEIVLEVSEGSLQAFFGNWSELFTTLREHDIKIAIDDFGSGYQSINDLSSTGIDFVKLDRSFVTSLNNDANKMVIGRAIIEIARSLGAKVIAEGVETEQERMNLNAIDCCYAQGYLFSRPLSKEDALQYLKKDLMM